MPLRPTIPLLSLRPLKTLAPKPRQPERTRLQRSSTTTLASSIIGPRSPPICFCRRKACQLSSHKSYVKECKRVNPPGDGTVRPHIQQNAVKDNAYANSYAYYFTQSFVDVNIAAGRVDPFYKLPVPDSTHPQLHRLFHDCEHSLPSPRHSYYLGDKFFDSYLSVFTVQLNRALTFRRPSCFLSNPLGSFLAPTAMIDPAVCLSVIAMSATTAGIRTGQQARNASAQSLYSQAMRLLCDRLGSNSTTDQTIMAASNLWLVSVPFGNEAVIRQNRKVVHDLVRRRGGPSQLGMDGMMADYLTWAEVFAGVWLNEEPYVFSDVMPGFMIAPPPEIYGAAFPSPHVSETLHPTVIEICLTICRLTEVWEKATREDVTSQEYIYFYSTLKWVSIQRTQFRAKCFNSGTKDECLIHVIEIFRSNVFSTQPENKLFNLRFCSQLQSALKRTNISSYWDEQIQMLIWALFVVGTIEFEWESRHWFMDLLRRSISYTYANEVWPDTWREEALRNVKSFLWSEVRFAEHFRKICDEVEPLTAPQLQTEPDPLFAVGETETSGSKQRFLTQPEVQLLNTGRR